MSDAPVQLVGRRAVVRKRLLWGVGALALFATAAALFWPTYQEQLLNREVISGVSMVRRVGVVMVGAEPGESSLVDARRALLSNPEAMQGLWDHYRRWDRGSLESLTIGGVSMGRLIEDGALRESTGAALPAADSDWVGIGPIVICQRRDHYAGSGSPAWGVRDLIIAYVSETVRPRWWYVARADGSGGWLAEERGELNDDAAAREAWGLPPLPMPTE